jgi:hypothetical protein
MKTQKGRHVHFHGILLKTLAMAALTTAQMAAADECDYVGRHYKTDIEPVSATSYPESRQGDIVISPSLTVTVKNVGVNSIEGNGDPNSIIHARRLSLLVKGTVLYGWMNAPLEPGESTSVSFNLPEGLVQTCERITVTIDPARSVGQAGCAVHSNDSITFQARFRSPMCRIDIPPRYRLPVEAEDTDG